MGFVDLHCHLLWGIDDGPRTAEDSVAMARALVELGFGCVAPSPHARPQFPGADEVERRQEEVARALATEGIALALERGAENYLDEEFIGRVESGAPRAIGAGRYVLVEAPHTSPVAGLQDLLFRVRLKGLVPVMAHPERCLEFQKKGQAEKTVEMGSLLQLDLGALIGRYGKPAQKQARTFLDAGFYALAATDLHGPVGALEWVARAIEELRSRVKDAGVERLLSVNPTRILRGEEVIS